MTAISDTRDAMEALLLWYRDMGVDIAVDGAPRDRFADAAGVEVATAASKTAAVAAQGSVAQAQTAPRAEPTARPRLPLDAAAISADAAVQTARERAAAARSLDELRDALLAFEGCALKATATQLVFADGNPDGRVMAIGEAPGADEDRQGLPFVGRSGQLFDRMLRAIGLDRTQVYIANVVPWRPPGNRTPSPQEVAVCLPFILRQIELADPALVVCLGGSATQALLPVKDGILRLRGRWFDLDTGNKLFKTMPMLHPAYLLRTPAHKKQAWRDLRALRRALDAP